jgi:TrmH family RNA methyltransferase
MALLGRDARARRETGEILCEGEKLLLDALSRGVAPIAVLYAKGAALPALPPDTRLFETDADVVKSVSSQKTPQGILFTVPRPQVTGAVDLSAKHILLDRVQDPGNVGAVIRTAEAFGLGSVMLAGGCADPFGPKALRAAMGAALRHPIREVNADNLPPLALVALDARGEDIKEFPPGPCIAVIGSEGAGIQPSLLARCTRRLRIPMKGGAESLNAAVAAGIFMWVMSR